jgi:serine protease Do
MSTKTIAILAALAVVGLLLVAATPAPPAPPAPRAPASPAAAPAPPAPPAEDHFYFFSAGGTWLGVQIGDIDEERARALGLKEEMGAEVQEVVPDSPAAEAGLEEKDVILEYQGTPVQGVAQLTRMVRETPAGRTVRLKVFRDGSPRELTVKMTEREGRRVHERRLMRRHDRPRVVIPKIDIPKIEIPDIPAIEGFGRVGYMRLGVMTDNLNEQLGEFFGVRNGEGVLVRSVMKGTPAEKAGLRAGDVIVKVDGERVSDASDLRNALRGRRDRDVTLTIVRDRKEQSLKVPPPPKGERARPRSRPIEDDEEETESLKRELRQEIEDLEEEDLTGHDVERIRKDVERIKQDVRKKVMKEKDKIKEEARRMVEASRFI